jgi:hypothetical protein
MENIIDPGSYQAYCLHCKDTVDVKEAELVTMKTTGMKAIKGKCIKCGGKIYKILPKKK